jgi:hypothetical protein
MSSRRSAVLLLSVLLCIAAMIVVSVITFLDKDAQRRSWDATVQSVLDTLAVETLWSGPMATATARPRLITSAAPR